MGGAATTLAIERGRLDNGAAGRERSAGVLRESAGLLGIRVWVLVFTRLYWSARGGRGERPSLCLAVAVSIRLRTSTFTPFAE